MNGLALRKGQISEDAIQDALTTARGDIFVASAYLGCPVRELDGYIRRSDYLQAFVGMLYQVKADNGYKKLTEEQFQDQLELKMRYYKNEAVDVIHSIATMPMPDNAAMMDVKLKAAVQLKGEDKAAKVVDGGQGQLLDELRDLYLAKGSHIKTLRAGITQTVCIEIDS